MQINALKQSVSQPIDLPEVKYLGLATISGYYLLLNDINLKNMQERVGKVFVYQYDISNPSA